MRRAEKAGFVRYPDWQNEYHQDGKGRREIKYGHPDGREVIFDGDTGKPVDDPRIEGTYNYAPVPPFGPEGEYLTPSDWAGYLLEHGSPQQIAEFLTKSVGHATLDIFPPWIEDYLKD